MSGFSDKYGLCVHRILREGQKAQKESFWRMRSKFAGAVWESGSWKIADSLHYGLNMEIDLSICTYIYLDNPKQLDSSGLLQ